MLTSNNNFLMKRSPRLPVSCRSCVMYMRPHHTHFLQEDNLRYTLLCSLRVVVSLCLHSVIELIPSSEETQNSLVPCNDRRGKIKLCQELWNKILDSILIHHVSLNCTHDGKPPILLSFSLAREITHKLRVPYNDRRGKNELCQKFWMKIPD